jgi:adenine-specific DNA-methyltransferase
MYLTLILNGALIAIFACPNWVYLGIKFDCNLFYLSKLEMTTSICEICGKEFTKKAGLEKHKQRKNPCKQPLKLIEASVHQALVKAGVSHIEVPIGEFREASKKFNNSLSKEERQNQGIFFTPKKARDILFTKLSELNVKPTRILEPSFGTGEFLLDAKRLYPEAKIFGVEKNKDLFKSVNCPDANLTCCDFLEWKGTADLIIGNPPYFVIKTDKLSSKEKKEFATKNSNAMTGRPNIYILFLYKCLTEHLEDDGFLAFIIPTSLYNCSYYQPIRNYIQKHTTIKYVETLDKPGFYETGQETMLIIIQKKKLNDDYIFKAKSGNIYISPFYKELYDITKDTKTLSDLGLCAKTGNIVWNQVKDNLSDKGTLLIYSSNIKDSELKIDNLCGKQRKQYVKDITKPTLSGPLILVERGYGNSFSFNSVLVDLKDFYAENHINVIYPKTSENVENLNKVMKSFQDERSKQFIKWFIGNGSISATDLETIIPIF